MRILVTGGSGFIGTNLIQSLLEARHEILNVDTMVPRNPAHENAFQRVDILDAERLSAVVGGFQPTHVVHLAARADMVEGSASDLYAVNTTGTRNLIDAMSTAKSVQRCIFASTKLVCRNGATSPDCGDYCPDTTYGESKAEMEQLIRKEASMPWTWCIVRPTSIWGPWFGVPYRGFFEAIAGGRYMHLGHIDPPRSFGYVGNVVHQTICLLTAAPEDIQAKMFYLTDVEEYRIRTWANSIAAVLGRRPPRTLPEVLVRLAARIGDGLKFIGWSNPPLTSFRLNNMRTDTSQKFSEDLLSICGPPPVSLNDAIDETIAWLREQNVI